jgi:hypothetical protein
VPLVTEVLPRLEEPILIDVYISAGKPSLAETDSPVSTVSATDQGDITRV